jgi:hypothetical protein
MRRYWTEDGRFVAVCTSCGKEDTVETLLRYTGDRWIGVDLDGTLAVDVSTNTLDKIGPPIPSMLARVKKWVADGRTVKIFTARAAVPKQIRLVKEWLARNGLPDLEVTNLKDFGMAELWDDRCVQVETNSGKMSSPRPKQSVERRISGLILRGGKENRLISYFKVFFCL